jgi:hypothetical protein
MADRQIEILLELIDRLSTTRRGTARTWGAIKGLYKTATWRPAAGRHNIWELILHAAYWKYIAHRRLLNEKRGSFLLKGSDWFVRPSKNNDNDTALKADIALLVETHNRLRRTVTGIKGKDLDHMPSGTTTSSLALIMGIASHDLYHAGQIQLLKRLSKRGSG